MLLTFTEILKNLQVAKDIQLPVNIADLSKIVIYVLSNLQFASLFVFLVISPVWF